MKPWSRLRSSQHRESDVLTWEIPNRFDPTLSRLGPQIRNAEAWLLFQKIRCNRSQHPLRIAEPGFDAALWTVSAYCDPPHGILPVGQAGLVPGVTSQEVVAAFPAREAVLNSQHMADKPGLEAAVALIEKAALVIKDT